MCPGCPFNFFSEESEKIQNYGCLLTPMDIVSLRIDHGKTWSCHEDTDKVCSGAIEYLKERNQPYKVIDSELVNMDNFDFKKLKHDQVETWRKANGEI